MNVVEMLQKQFQEAAENLQSIQKGKLSIFLPKRLTSRRHFNKNFFSDIPRTFYLILKKKLRINLLTYFSEQNLLEILQLAIYFFLHP